MSHNKIELSENQLAPAKAKPEDFKIERFDTEVSVTGQESNDQEAEAKSYRTNDDRGSNYNDTTTN
jgi:hypothetical protein